MEDIEFCGLFTQRFKAFDSRTFDSIVKGYLVLTLQAQGKDKAEIWPAIMELSKALKEHSAEQAEEAFKNL